MRKFSNIFLFFLTSLAFFISFANQQSKKDFKFFTFPKNKAIRLKIVNVSGFVRGYYLAKGLVLNFKHNQSITKKSYYVSLKSRKKVDLWSVGNVISLVPSRIYYTKNLSQSSYKDYLKKNNEIATLIIYPPLDIQFYYQEKDFNYFINVFQKKIENKLKKYIGDPSYSLSLALVTGNKKEIPQDFKNDFRQTGTYHVLAVSGMHAGIIFLVFFSLLRFLNFKRKTVLLILFFFVFPLYLVLTNFQTSIVRTYFMLLLGFLVGLTGRKTEPLRIYFFVFDIFLFIRPQSLFDISFQLSFAAVFGILLMVKVIQLYQIKNKVFIYFLVSLAAQFFTAPFLIFYFGYLNYFSLFYNSLILFLIPLSLVLSLVFLLSPFILVNQYLGHSLEILNRSIFFIIHSLKRDFISFHLNYQNNYYLSISMFLGVSSILILLIVRGLSRQSDLPKDKNGTILSTSEKRE